jgi:hypothetical protein
MRYCVCAGLLVDLENSPKAFQCTAPEECTSYNQSEFEALPDVPSPPDVVASENLCPTP